MNIPDVDLVMVYGVPKNMSEMYQVIKRTSSLLYNYVCVIVQLFGRAGRSGGLLRAHLFYSKQKKKLDVEIKDFCYNKENCPRRSILKAIGDKAPVDSFSTLCCSNCSSSRLSLPSKLAICESTPVIPNSNKRSAHWKTDKTIDETLRNRLLEERQKYVSDHPVFAMIGEKAVCPNCVIDTICKEARFIRTKEDISDIVGLRPELQDTLSVILDVLSVNPISRKRRRIN